MQTSLIFLTNFSIVFEFKSQKIGKIANNGQEDFKGTLKYVKYDG